MERRGLYRTCRPLGRSQWSVVVTMVAMRMMQVTGDAVIGVITVRNSLVTTPWAMDMTRIVTAVAVV